MNSRTYQRPIGPQPLRSQTSTKSKFATELERLGNLALASIGGAVHVTDAADGKVHLVGALMSVPSVALVDAPRELANTILDAISHIPDTVARDKARAAAEPVLEQIAALRP